MVKVLARTARRISRTYGKGNDDAPPVGGHAAALAAFGVYTAAWAGAVRARGLPMPVRPEPWDVLLTSVATFRLSRLVSKSSVTNPLRAPFTRYEGQQGPAEVAEEPREGPRHVVGELLTCPFCVSVWTVATLTGASLLWPRATRTVTGALAALAGSDALQFAYTALSEKVTGDD
ncbi:DUF1360 domain-containing protein [Streptomyces sp. NPDC006368]|uniref:DUF1360 domain-containing protein n=1 Tax=Streptomyces sp. NPDC006368 TaxID=3156760 RepID=UPI0033AE9C6A